MLTTLQAGTSGYRGVYGEEITEAHARAIGYEHGAILMRRHVGEDVRVTVGHDQRAGAASLARAVADGLLNAGVSEVIFLGQVSTGVFSVATAITYQVHGGILVTGSHMPPERVGIIPINGDASYCMTEVTDRISAFMSTFPDEVEVPTLGALLRQREFTLVKGNESQRGYLEALLAHLNRRAVRARQFRILVDAGNGTTGQVAEALFETLGVETSMLFAQPQAKPDRPSECRPESCKAAIRLMKEAVHDMGICLDGDGDRVMFIDEDGNVVPNDVIAAIFAKHILTKGDVVVTPVDASGLIEAVAAEAGVRVEYCKIGQPDTGRAIREFGAAFAYEACAKFAMMANFSWYDGVFMAAKMLEIMVTRGMRLSQLVAELPVFFKIDQSIPLPAAIKDVVVAAVYARAREVFADDGAAVLDIDGLRFTFDDETWVLLRPSGTEPMARVYADSRSERSAREVLETALAIFTEQIAAHS